MPTPMEEGRLGTTPTAVKSKWPFILDLYHKSDSKSSMKSGTNTSQRSKAETLSGAGNNPGEDGPFDQKSTVIFDAFRQWSFPQFWKMM